MNGSLQSRMKLEVSEQYGWLKARVEDKPWCEGWVAKSDIIANWYLGLKSHLLLSLNKIWIRKL